MAGDEHIVFEEKLACVLVVDVSGSMGPKMDKLNQGLQKFKDDIMRDEETMNRLEVGIITFNHKVETAMQMGAIDKLIMPVLAADGSTKLVDGVREGIRMVEARKKQYTQLGMPYKRPYVLLVTDGEPDPGQDVIGLAREIKTGVNDKHFVFWAFGVEGANYEMLEEISMDDKPPLQFDSKDFGKFFEWLSNSLSNLSKAKKGEDVNIAPKTNFFQMKVD